MTTDDLIAALREWSQCQGGPLCKQGAEEIERLREALLTARDHLLEDSPTMALRAILRALHVGNGGAQGEDSPPGS